MTKRPRPAHFDMEADSERVDLPASKMRRIHDHVSDELKRIRRRSESDIYNSFVRTNKETVEDTNHKWREVCNHLKRREHRHRPKEKGLDTCHDLLDQIMVFNTKTVEQHANFFMQYDGQHDQTESGTNSEADGADGTSHVKQEPVTVVKIKSLVFGKGSSMYNPIVVFDGEEVDIDNDGVEVGDVRDETIEVVDLAGSDEEGGKTSGQSDRRTSTSQHGDKSRSTNKSGTDLRDKIFSKTGNSKVISITLTTGGQRQVKSHGHLPITNTDNNSRTENKPNEKCNGVVERNGATVSDPDQCKAPTNSAVSTGVELNTVHKERKTTKTEDTTVAKCTNDLKHSSCSMHSRQNQSESYKEKSAIPNNNDKPKHGNSTVGKENIGRSMISNKPKTEPDCKYSGGSQFKQWRSSNNVTNNVTQHMGRNRRQRFNRDRRLHVNKSENFFHHNQHSAGNYTNNIDNSTPYNSNTRQYNEPTTFHNRERYLKQINHRISWFPPFCDTCGALFRYRQEFLGHIRKMNHCPFFRHYKWKIDSFRCSYCLFDSRSWVRIMIHYMVSHGAYFRHTRAREVFVEVLCTC